MDQKIHTIKLKNKLPTFANPKTYRKGIQSTFVYSLKKQDRRENTTVACGGLLTESQ